MAAQHRGHEIHHRLQAGDVRHLTGRDVLDPADHATRQVGAHVQVQDEGTLGGQFETGRLRAGGS